jgi:ATP-dependent Clp protease protease subunit
MAGDKIIIPINAMMMIHKCWTIALGNAAEMRKIADDLDKIDESIVAAYIAKTGLEEADIIELMEDETWMTAQDAIDYGFADEIEESKQVAASLRNGVLVVNGQEVDISKFNNVPDFPKSKKITRTRAQPTPVPAPAPEPEPVGQALQIAKAKMMLELEMA